ncbi:hypothetical protein JCM3765_002781 [Sporobolomyces pararoseus]
MEAPIPILVSLYHPFPRTLSLSLPSTSPISSLSSLLSTYCPPSSQLLQYSSGRSLPSPTAPLAALNHGQTNLSAPVFLRLAIKLPGGKGGFASQLRAQGGRMSSNKAQNHDSCRGLDGRRLSTIKEAQRLVKLLESEPDRQAAAAKAAEAKLEALNNEIKQLERAAGVESSAPIATGSGSAEASTSGGGGGGGGIKRRLDDTKYIEESREIVSGVKDAVRAAMMKKRKKAAKPAPTEEPSTSNSTAGTSASNQDEKEKEKENAVPAATEEEAVTEETKEESEAGAKGKGKTATGGKGKGKAVA